MNRKSGDYKKLNLPFCDRILSEPQYIIDRTVDEMQYWAERVHSCVWSRRKRGCRCRGDVPPFLITTLRPTEKSWAADLTLQ